MLLLWTCATACTATREAAQKPQPAQEAADSALVPVESGFLSDYSDLKPSQQFAALLLYRDDSRKEGYRKLLFRPVEVWRGADHRLEDIPEEDLQYLADALYHAISSRLAKSFQMVTEPGPGVLEIHLAFTLVTDPKSPVDFFSTTVPVRDLPAREGPLAEATRRFVQDSALEAEFLDVRAGRGSKAKPSKTVRAAYFDSRRGADTPKGTVQTWQDVNAVFARWATILDERLEELREGTFRPRLTIKEDEHARPAR